MRIRIAESGVFDPDQTLEKTDLVSDSRKNNLFQKHISIHGEKNER